MDFTDGFLIGGGIVLVIAMLGFILYLFLTEPDSDSDSDLDQDEVDAMAEKVDALTARLLENKEKLATANITLTQVEPTTPTKGNK